MVLSYILCKELSHNICWIFHLLNQATQKLCLHLSFLYFSLFQDQLIIHITLLIFFELSIIFPYLSSPKARIPDQPQSIEVLVNIIELSKIIQGIWQHSCLNDVEEKALDSSLRNQMTILITCCSIL